MFKYYNEEICYESIKEESEIIIKDFRYADLTNFFLHLRIIAKLGSIDNIKDIFDEFKMKNFEESARFIMHYIIDNGLKYCDSIFRSNFDELKDLA